MYAKHPITRSLPTTKKELDQLALDLGYIPPSQVLDPLVTPPPQELTPPTPVNEGVSEVESPLPGKGLNPAGRGIHRRKVEEFEELSPKEQNEHLRGIWKSVAMGIAQRAKSFSTTCSPKDFGRLYQLVMSGAVSIDKAFPPKEQLQNPQLVVNLFSSLGQKAARIAIPLTPEIIDVTPCATLEQTNNGSPGLRSSPELPPAKS